MNPEKQMQLLSTYDMTACMSNCSNNGVCKFSNDKYSCECFPDFIGERCQTNSNPCSYYPCLNNATCNEQLNVNQTILMNQKVWDFSCNCSQFYFGNRCQSKINVCENETCNGNGLCFDNSSVATCQCFIYFNGSHCETEETVLVTIKQVTAGAAIIAISFISLFYSSFFAMDFLKFKHLMSTTPPKISTVNLPRKIIDNKIKPMYKNYG